MTATAVQYFSFAEFEKLPDHAGKLELLNGELIELPPAKRRHNEIAERTFLHLRKLLAGISPGGKVHMEMGYRFTGTDSWLQPDVSLTHPGQLGEDYYIDAPALAVEVVSDSNSPRQMAAKVREYLAHGGREVWLVYPQDATLWIYRANGTFECHTGAFYSDVFPGATLNVADFLPETH